MFNLRLFTTYTQKYEAKMIGKLRESFQEGLKYRESKIFFPTLMTRTLF